MIDLLNTEFNEQQWYIANLYLYLNYDSTTDYPINLEHVYKMIGFANKGNAMKTIKSNFTLNEDYKVVLLRMEQRKNAGGQNRNQQAAFPNGKAGSSKNLGGAGLNKEDVVLNIDCFKSLCMIAKTPQGKEIRKYYVKLEIIIYIIK